MAFGARFKGLGGGSNDDLLARSRERESGASGRGALFDRLFPNFQSGRSQVTPSLSVFDSAGRLSRGVQRDDRFADNQRVQAQRDFRGQLTTNTQPNRPLNFSVGAWWESPGIRFTQKSGGGQTAAIGPGGEQFGASVPQWASFDFDTPESFYRWVQSASPDQIDTLRSGGLDRQARRDAIENLGGVRGDTQTTLESFRNDESRQALINSLTTQSGADFRQFSEIQESALRNQIAQISARQQALNQGSAASRGLVTSGVGDANNAVVRALSQSQALRLSGEIDQRNQAAREDAGRTLGNFSDRGVQIETSLLSALSNIDIRIAELQANSAVLPTDFTAFRLQDFGLEAFEREEEFRRESLAAATEASQFGLLDFAQLALKLKGTGFFGGGGGGSGFDSGNAALGGVGAGFL